MATSSSPRHKLNDLRHLRILRHTFTHSAAMPARPARNVADATRFAQNVRNPPANKQGGETPQQRVARIREAARRERANKSISTFDKVVHHGRIWADRLHRGLVFSIIGFSAVTGTIFGVMMFDIVRHARRNKKEFNDILQVERIEALANWRTSEITRLTNAGLTNDEAIHVFDEAERVRRAANGAWGRLKTWATGGLTPAEEEYVSNFELQEARIKERVLAEVQADRKVRLMAKKGLEETGDGAAMLEGGETERADAKELTTPNTIPESEHVSTSTPHSEILGKVEDATSAAEKKADSMTTSILKALNWR